MNNKNISNNIRVRYNIITVMIYIIGIILLLGLFNLQIIHGKEYRETSNTRLTRETSVEAARGDIFDKNGNILATVEQGYNLILYKTKIDESSLNETLLNIINTLEKNNDKYYNDLPLKINPIRFEISEEEQIKWKKKYSIPEEYDATQVFNFLKDKYKITNEKEEDIFKIMILRFQISKNGYSSVKAVQLAGNISRESALIINEKNDMFPGVTIVSSSYRKYLYDNLASHILGYVGKISENELNENKDKYEPNDIVGKTGIEYVFEKYLKGVDGKKQIDMSINGTVGAEEIVQEAVDGNDIVLTIDANLQQVAQNALKKNIEKISNGGFSETSKADSGAVVAVNVNSGEVLAMASYPDFNLSDFSTGISQEKWKEYNTNESRPLYNRAVQASYAPGSTFKMVSALAALETNLVTINEKINCTGVYPNSYHPVCWIWTSNHTGHGPLNITEAIKHSCNYFFYEMGYRIGIDNLVKYASYLGLGRKTGIELPGEKEGTLAKKEILETKGKQWYVADTLSASIGQSYNDFSPIQMAKYMSMLTNGGKSIDITLIKNIINENNESIDKAEIENYLSNNMGIKKEKIEDLSINQNNLNAILEGMRQVTTESGGTAYSTFKDFSIEVGGKTGSSQAGEKTNGWFVGFAPYDKPEIAIVVMVENAGHGGYTAEVAKEILSEYFGLNTKNITEDVKAIEEIEMQR